MDLLTLVPIVGLLGVLYALYLFYYIIKQPAGNQTMQDIAELIQKGASAFLKREYSTLAIFIVVMFIILWAVIKIETAIAFVSGALCSMLAGFIGMTSATRANVRTAQAATQGQNRALVVSFTGGSVMGLTVASIGLIGLGIFYLLYKDPTIISGFGMGASSIALFARVGGGIYQKVQMSELILLEKLKPESQKMTQEIQPSLQIMSEIMLAMSQVWGLTFLNPMLAL